MLKLTECCGEEKSKKAQCGRRKKLMRRVVLDVAMSIQFGEVYKFCALNEWMTEKRFPPNWWVALFSGLCSVSKLLTMSVRGNNSLSFKSHSLRILVPRKTLLKVSDEPQGVIARETLESDWTARTWELTCCYLYNFFLVCSVRTEEIKACTMKEYAFFLLPSSCGGIPLAWRILLLQI